VDDISVEVAVSEILAVVGPSGSGKSSFLRLLNRLDEPTSGTVFLDHVDYRQIPSRELRLQVAMVTQRAFLFPGTVYDNVTFGPQQRGELFPSNRVESC
jgi:putative ABC transport system ATP-binding protein